MMFSEGLQAILLTFFLSTLLVYLCFRYDGGGNTNKLSRNLKERTKRDLLNYFTEGPEKFKNIAISTAYPGKPTDKVTTHSYQTMYGMYLLPLVVRAKKNKLKLKFLEIGMGCDMTYGPGKSVALWKSLFEDFGDLWESEVDVKCVQDQQEKGLLGGINTLTGDQGQTSVLRKWIKESNGGFDVIIDDGGHFNSQIKTTFDVMWTEALNPGGLYFIEDLCVGRLLHSPVYGHYDDTNGTAVMSDIIQSWIEQMLIPPHWIGKDPMVKEMRTKFPIPHRLKWITCQKSACVMAKCLENDAGMCSPF